MDIGLQVGVPEVDGVLEGEQRVLEPLDLRVVGAPAVVILLAMLASKGTSVLRSVYVINRGYEDLATRLNLLGARIETFRDI